VKLTTHHQLVPRLQVTGTIALLPLNAFMACTGTTLPLSVENNCNIFR